MTIEYDVVCKGDWLEGVQCYTEDDLCATFDTREEAEQYILELTYVEIEEVEYWIEVTIGREVPTK